MGTRVLTEAIFKKETRCDVQDLTEGAIYEILHSDRDKEFEKKIKRYPKELNIIKIKVESKT